MRKPVVREGQGVANRTFKKIIEEDFKNWAERKKVEPTPDNMLSYLMRRSLIDPKTINYFLIQHIYKEKRQEGLSKKQSIFFLENQVPYKYRRIYQCLDQYGNRYIEKNLQFD